MDIGVSRGIMFCLLNIFFVMIRGRWVCQKSSTVAHVMWGAVPPFSDRGGAELQLTNSGNRALKAGAEASEVTHGSKNWGPQLGAMTEAFPQT